MTSAEPDRKRWLWVGGALAAILALVSWGVVFGPDATRPGVAVGDGKRAVDGGPHLGGREREQPPPAPSAAPGAGTREDVPGDPFTLTVRIRDAAGVNVEGAQVVASGRAHPLNATPAAPGQWSIRTTTDTCPWVLECSAHGCVGRRVTLACPGGDERARDVVVSLRPDFDASVIRVGGQVLDPKGRYVSDARVTLTGSGKIARETVTGRHGEFSFVFDAPHGPWELLRVEPPANRLLSSWTRRDVDVPNHFPQIRLKSLPQGYGTIDATAPSPRGIVPWDGKTPVELLLLDEETGFGLGGGGTASSLTQTFRRVRPGNYKVVARVGDITYAAASATVVGGGATRVNLMEAVAPRIQGHFDGTWAETPVAVRVLPVAILEGTSSGAYDQFDAAMMAAWDTGTAMHLRGRVRRGRVGPDRRFDLQAAEAGRLVLDVLDGEGRSLARIPFTARSGGSGSMELGGLSDPGGRRPASIRLTGMTPVAEGLQVVVSLLDRSGVVHRRELALEDGALDLGSLLPGVYMVSMFRSEGSGVHRGVAPVFRLEIPQGTGPVEVHWDLPETPRGG